MKKIIYILLIVSTSTQSLARLNVNRLFIDDNFLPKQIPLSSKGDTYDRIRKPFWDLLTRASHAGISIDTLPVEIDSDRPICVDEICPHSDEQAQLSLRTTELLKQRKAEAEQLVQQQEKPKGKTFSCFKPFHYRFFRPFTYSC